MIKRFFYTGFAILITVFVLSGCATKKHLKEGEYFINKYKLTITKKSEGIEASEIKSFFRPKPNSKIFGIRWKAGTYYRRQSNPSKFNKWAFKNFGEEPNLYYEDDLPRIALKTKKYLDNVGYFNSQVSYDVEFGNKIANLSFTVKPATPYIIREISYDVPDSVLNTFFMAELKKTLIKEGDIYNAYVFDNERDRITNYLRDVGYYYFNRNYIQFIVDSSYKKHEMTVVLKINNVKKQVVGFPGQFTEHDHIRYYIKDVTVIPDWIPTKDQVFDTVLHQIYFWDVNDEFVYKFLLDEKRRLKPKAFNTSINLQPHTPYSASKLQSTYRNLFNFRIIRTATITFDTVGAGKSEDGAYHYLNSRIQMQTSKLNSFQIEAEGTNSSGDLGIRGSIVFTNKNIFKMGDVLSLRVKGGYEAQTFSTSGENTDFFSTFEAGANGNIFFPRFLFPIKLAKFNKRFHPITNLNFGFNYQERKQFYKRNITNLDIGYTWNLKAQIKHIFTPLNINYVNITLLDEALKNEIDTTINQRLKEQYSDHLIFGFSYSFIFNNQNIKSLKSFNYFRVNFESSGNFLYGMNKLFNSPENAEGHYELLGVRYAQYIRISTDFRHYDYFGNKENGLVYRFLLGVAFPYLNSNQITYEKGFYGGGANDMRGWVFRMLGPGGFPGFAASNSAQNQYERIGEIQIEGNIEYRFPVYDWIKGALFVDVGNIWQLNKSDLYPYGEFNWDTWYDQLAMDVGVGVRFDFSFFVFRVDVASPIRQPSKYTTGNMWSKPDIFVFNFGIGYPF